MISKFIVFGQVSQGYDRGMQGWWSLGHSDMNVAGGEGARKREGVLGQKHATRK